jgi:predicted ATPase
VAGNAERFFVLTGGPGSGKSTLIDALESAGFARSVEAGRGVIQDQVAIGGHALPWRDPSAFAELMLCWEMRSYHLAERQDGPVFFDRGVPDVVGYLRLSGLPVPRHMETAAAETFRYHRRVLIAPPGRRSSGRTASAGRTSTKPCGPMRRWSRPTPATATSWSSFPGFRSGNGSASSWRASASFDNDVRSCWHMNALRRRPRRRSASRPDPRRLASPRRWRAAFAASARA